MKAKEWLIEKGVHHSEPIYWEFINQTIYLNELLDMFAVDSLKEYKLEKLVPQFKYTEDGHILIGSSCDDGSGAQAIISAKCIVCGALFDVVTYGRGFCPHCGNEYAIQAPPKEL